MKVAIFLFSILCSMNSLALDWYDLDLDQSYKLDKTLVFEKEGIKLEKGESFKFYESIALPANVVLYQFEVENCPGPDLTTDMIIVDPSRETNDPSVGVQLAESCSLEIYVETKDIMSKSLFITK